MRDTLTYHPGDKIKMIIASSEELIMKSQLKTRNYLREIDDYLIYIHCDYFVPLTCSHLRLFYQRDIKATSRRERYHESFSMVLLCMQIFMLRNNWLLVSNSLIFLSFPLIDQGIIDNYYYVN